MSKLETLRKAATLHDVARLLGFKSNALAYILYGIPDTAKYTEYKIAKRSGGTREIHAPIAKLKLLQRRTAELFQDCIEELEHKGLRADRFVHGFRRGRSIITNASRHRNRRLVVNLDLSDFFGAINFGRVRGLLSKDEAFSLQPSVATIFAKIACYGNALPQGSPCSPVFANLVARSLDLRLIAHCKRSGFLYTRYADDITLSSRRKDPPTEIVQRKLGGGLHSWELTPSLVRVIDKSGFSVNAGKTRVQYRDSRQDVTGLVVNRRINVPREYRRQVRAMVHRLTTTGAFQIRRSVMGAGGAAMHEVSGTLEELQGMLGYIATVDAAAEENNKDNAEAATSQRHIYRRFLFYREFFCTDRPVIVCEGKTDNVYLRAALRKLAPDFPSLVSVTASGEIRLNVRLYKADGKKTSALMGLTGGAAPLLKFLHEYRTESETFVSKKGRFPLIVVVDNDEASKNIFSFIKKVTGSHKAVDGSEQYYRLMPMVFVVPIPKPSGCSSAAIEALFEKSLLDTVHKGKTFHGADKGFDKDKHYTKAVFAHEVVQRHADKISFDGFRPLLTTIADVVGLSSPPGSAPATAAVTIAGAASPTVHPPTPTSG